MALTQNTYTGDGTTVLFSFTFPYLETTDIKVSLNGTITTAYTLANATTIQFNTAPANGAAIRIYRVTDDAALAAQFYPGSAIRSQDLNDNFTQNLYVTQESNRDATSAITTANSALTASASATSTSNTALSQSSTALSNSAAAVSTANTASSNATTALSQSSAAVTTANSSQATATSAAADAASALSASATASSNASTALSQSNTALSNSSTALSQSSTALSNSASAVTTAGTASSNASTALSTANTAISTANAAASAVANAILYDTVANVAAIPGSPSNNDAVEVVNSTGIESFSPLSGLPSGFVGDSGLSVRLVYTTTGATWNWIQYFPNDPEDRYGDAITALQGDVSTAQSDITTLQSDVLGLDTQKLDATTAASTYQTQAGMSSYLTTAAASSTYQTQAAMSSYVENTDLASTSVAGIVQLTDSTSSTSTTTAGTPNAIKSAYDLANAAVPKSLVDAKGDLLVATANDTVSRLAVGSNNQVLTADSTAGTGLKWATPASGSWRFISSVTASNSASVAFTSGIDSTYDIYVLAFSGVESTSGQADLNLRFSTNGGSSYFSGANDYIVRLARNVTALIIGTAQTAIKITDQVTVTTANTPVSGFVYLLNASVSGKHTAALIYSAELDSPANNHGVGRSLSMGTGVVNAVQFSPSTGNMNGTFRLYGISNS